MKSNKVCRVLLISGSMLIITGLVIGIYFKKKVNFQEKETKESGIIENYDNFKSKIELFNKERENYYNEVVNDLYVENVKVNYEEWIELLDNYTQIVTDVENASITLKKECINFKTDNQDVKNKCKAFIIAYETAMNYYAKDIEAFNEIIEKYITINSDDTVKVYNGKYNYTDIDYDGNFYGKN